MSNSDSFHRFHSDDAEDISLSAPNRNVDIGSDRPMLFVADNNNHLKAGNTADLSRTNSHPQIICETEANVSCSETRGTSNGVKTGRRPGTRSSAALANAINRPGAVAIESSCQVEAQGNESSGPPSAPIVSTSHLPGNSPPILEAELVVPSSDVEDQHRFPGTGEMVDLVVQQLRRNVVEAEVVNGTAGEDDNSNNGKKPTTTKLCSFVILVVVIIVVVSILLVKLLPKQNSASSLPSTATSLPSPKNDTNTTSPALLTRTDAFPSLMIANNISEERLLNTTTPQYRAMNWLAEVDHAKLEVNATSTEIIMERFVLALMYFATDGLNWDDQSRFLSGVSVCYWQGQGGLNDRGVYCNIYNRTERLVIEGNQLGGTIPSEIGLLSNLQELRLSQNKLAGTIPTEMGFLLDLEILSLSNNTLVGSIPVEVWSLPNIQQFYTWDNQLTGTIPTEIGRLRQALAIDVSGNALTGSIPSEIGMLVNLEVLKAFQNLLSGKIPTEIGELKQLQNINLKDGMLSGSIPSGIWGLTSLTGLFLRDNDLTGTISSEIGALTNLVLLELLENQLSGTIPTEIGNLDQLTHLVVLDNDLRGTIPTEIGRLTSLEFFSFRRNKLTGTLPSEVGQFSRIGILDGYSNKLHGTVPTELASSALLVDVFLGMNNFVDDFTSTFCNLTTHQLKFETLQADCGEVVCPCCTSCCSEDGCEDHDPLYVN